MTEDQAFEAWKSGRHVTPRPPCARAGEEALISSIERPPLRWWYEPDDKKRDTRVTLRWLKTSREEYASGQDESIYIPSDLMFLHSLRLDVR